jgi:hypothetical protein
MRRAGAVFVACGSRAAAAELGVWRESGFHRPRPKDRAMSLEEPDRCRQACADARSDNIHPRIAYPSCEFRRWLPDAIETPASSLPIAVGQRERPSLRLDNTDILRFASHRSVGIRERR